MPDIVAHGKRPDVRACGLCHYPNGKGRQENAGVAGLPVWGYFFVLGLGVMTSKVNVGLGGLTKPESSARTRTV